MPVLALNYQHCASAVSVSPVVGFSFLLYVFSLAANVFAERKMAQYPGGRARRCGSRDTNPPPLHTRTHTPLVFVAAKQRNIPREAMTCAESLIFYKQTLIFAHDICLFVRLLFVPLPILVFIFNIEI